MKPRIAFVLPLALFVCGAGAQQPAAPLTVPAKIIGYHNGPHSAICSDYIPADALRQVKIVRATITVTVNPDGTVKTANVQEDSGRPEIANAFMTCALNWLFVPATVGGKPVESTDTNYQVVQAY